MKKISWKNILIKSIFYYTLPYKLVRSFKKIYRLYRYKEKLTLKETNQKFAVTCYEDINAKGVYKL